MACSHLVSRFFFFPAPSIAPSCCSPAKTTPRSCRCGCIICTTASSRPSARSARPRSCVASLASSAGRSGTSSAQMLLCLRLLMKSGSVPCAVMEFSRTTTRVPLQKRTASTRRRNPRADPTQRAVSWATTDFRFCVAENGVESHETCSASSWPFTMWPYRKRPDVSTASSCVASALRVPLLSRVLCAHCSHLAII